MNETSIYGVVEIYNKEEASKVGNTISEMTDNFFNVSFSKVYLKNTGSILIPFAKSMRADVDDLIFLKEKLTELISKFDWLDILAVEAYIDSFHHGKFIYQIVSHEGRLEWNKSICELKTVP